MFNTIKFLKDKKHKRGNPLSILCITGGKWSIDDTDYETFLRSFYNDCKNCNSILTFGSPSYVEVKSLIYKFFIDIDYKTEVISPGDCKKIAFKLTNAMTRLIGSKITMPMIALNMNRDEPTGIHLYYGDDEGELYVLLKRNYENIAKMQKKDAIKYFANVTKISSNAICNKRMKHLIFTLMIKNGWNRKDIYKIYLDEEKSQAPGKPMSKLPASKPAVKNLRKVGQVKMGDKYYDNYFDIVQQRNFIYLDTKYQEIKASSGHFLSTGIKGQVGGNTYDVYTNENVDFYYRGNDNMMRRIVPVGVKEVSKGEEKKILPPPPEEEPPKEGPPKEGPPKEGPPKEGPPKEGPPPERLFSFPKVTPPPEKISPPPEKISPPPEKISPPPEKISPPPEKISPPPEKISPPPEKISPPPEEKKTVLKVTGITKPTGTLNYILLRHEHVSNVPNFAHLYESNEFEKEIDSERTFFVFKTFPSQGEVLVRLRMTELKDEDRNLTSEQFIDKYGATFLETLVNGEVTIASGRAFGGKQKAVRVRNNFKYIFVEGYFIPIMKENEPKNRDISLLYDIKSGKITPFNVPAHFNEHLINISQRKIGDWDGKKLEKEINRQIDIYNKINEKENLPLYGKFVAFDIEGEFDIKKELINDITHIGSLQNNQYGNYDLYDTNDALLVIYKNNLGELQYGVL